MSRPSLPDAQLSPIAEDTARLGSYQALVDQAATLAEERRAAATELATRMQYDGELTPAALCDGIRLYQRRTVEDCLELGKRLLLLKELADPGSFRAIAEQLGFAQRTAYRFMQAALKTSGSVNLARLSSHVQSASVLLELLVLDDEDAGELLEGGSVRGLVLDDIERMPASKLRAALRDARATQEALERVVADKSNEVAKRDTEIQKLRLARERQSAAIPPVSPDEHRAELMAEVLRRTATIEVSILKDLDAALAALTRHAEQTGLPADEAIAGAVCQLERALGEVKHRYSVKDRPDGTLYPSDAAIWEAVERDFDRARAAEVDEHGSIQ